MTDENSQITDKIEYAFNRRTVLKGAFAVSTVGFGATTFSGPVFAQEEQSFSIEQGKKCFDVTPLSTGETVENFYNRSGAHSNTSTSIEQSNTSLLFLFEGPNGLSLVLIHDRPNDEGGGAVSADFSDLPDGSHWVVQDEPDSDIHDEYTANSADWFWFNENNDGGAIRLFEPFDLTASLQFNEDAAKWERFENIGRLDERGHITDWKFLCGDATNPNSISLNMEESIMIRTKVCTIQLSIDIKPGSNPNAINLDDMGLIPVAIRQTGDFDPFDRVNVDSLRFGDPEDVNEDDGASAAHDGHIEDVDRDGNDDLVVHFPTQDTGFDGDEDIGLLKGVTNDGTPLFGTDSVMLLSR